MKSVKSLVILFIFSLFIVGQSCNSDSSVQPIDDTVEETTDDTVEGTTDDTVADAGLSFSSQRHQVTFDLCNDTFCSVTQLVFLSEDIGYGVTGVDVYKTTDGAENWIHVLNQDIVGDLIPLSESLMFINTYDSILKTINGGSSWSSIDRPLSFECPDDPSINPGIIQFTDDSSGVIQDLCYRGDMYRTIDSGANWELIFNSADPISEFYFIDANNGFVIVNDLINLTNDGGASWSEVAVLPNTFDYVIEKPEYFMFPEGTANVNKPDIVSEFINVTQFDVNDNGDIAVVLFDQSVSSNQWQLMLYVNSDEPEWILIDQLDDLTEDYFNYSSIVLTEAKTIYISIWGSGDVIKYFLD